MAATATVTSLNWTTRRTGASNMGRPIAIANSALSEVSESIDIPDDRPSAHAVLIVTSAI